MGSFEQIFAIVSNHVCAGSWDGAILRRGELGVLIESNGAIIFKIGDGISGWNDLPFPNNAESVENIQTAINDLTGSITALENRVTALELGG